VGARRCHPPILAEIPSRLGRHVTGLLARWGVELRLSTRLVQVAGFYIDSSGNIHGFERSPAR
jgi:hypothetical protein